MRIPTRSLVIVAALVILTANVIIQVANDRVLIAVVSLIFDAVLIWGLITGKISRPAA